MHGGEGKATKRFMLKLPKFFFMLNDLCSFLVVFTYLVGFIGYGRWACTHYARQVLRVMISNGQQLWCFISIHGRFLCHAIIFVAIIYVIFFNFEFLEL